MHLNISGSDFYYLRKRGAIAIPSLSTQEVSALQAEARTFDLRPRDRITATGVTQDFFCYDFPYFARDSHFLLLARYTASALNHVFGQYGALGPPVAFNDFSLQRYPVSAPGQQYAISPHVDYKSCINLIAVFVLEGQASFCLCRDRTGAEPYEVRSKPGDLILMRGSGFGGELWRPFHFVGPVTEERLSFGLRQTADGRPLHKVYQEQSDAHLGA